MMWKALQQKWAQAPIVVLFTTGLGTPTGNPVAPVVKLATNTALFNRMPDILDINCGTIIEGTETIPDAASRIMDYIIEVASGNVQPKAVLLGQDDFIPGEGVFHS